MGGIFFLLLLLAFLWLFGSVVLMVACWLANRILGPVPAGIPTTTVDAAPNYRTVEAGPYTSPATAQDRGPMASEEEAVPQPSFVRAMVITGCPVLLVIGILGFFVLIPWKAPMGDSAPFFAVGLLGLFAAAAVHFLLLVWALPTTIPRALLVLVLEAIPMAVLIGLPCLVLPALLIGVRSSPPPPIAPSAPITAPMRQTPPPAVAPPEAAPAPGPASPE